MSRASLSRRVLGAVPLVVSVVLLTLIAVQFESTQVLEQMDLTLLLLGLCVSIFFVTTVGAFKWWMVILSAGVEARFGELGLGSARQGSAKVGAALGWARLGSARLG